MMLKPLGRQTAGNEPKHPVWLGCPEGCRRHARPFSGSVRTQIQNIQRDERRIGLASIYLLSNLGHVCVNAERVGNEPPHLPTEMRTHTCRHTVSVGTPCGHAGWVLSPSRWVPHGCNRRHARNKLLIAERTSRTSCVCVGAHAHAHPHTHAHF